MSLSNIALVGNQGMHGTSRAEFTYRFAVTLDAAYPAAGGYTGFFSGVQAAILAADQVAAAAIQATVGSTAPFPPNSVSGLARKSAISLKQVSFGGGYRCHWDRVNDKLLVSVGTNAGPDAECAQNLAGLNGVVVEFEAKCI